MTIEHDPTKITLPQVGVLQLLANRQAVSKIDAPKLKALERRGLAKCWTEPTGDALQPWGHRWTITDLGQAVLAGGVVHTERDYQADGQLRLLIFRNGAQVGEVRRSSWWSAAACRLVREWIAIAGDGQQHAFRRKDMAVAWAAGGSQ